jgi:hypothetical protein
MSYQDKILYKNSLSIELDKEYIIYKNNLLNNNINLLKSKIEELNNKIEFINSHKIILENNLENNIINSISILENTITLINRSIINKGNIKTSEY